MSGKSPRCKRIVMRPLSRACHRIPSLYLRDLRARLIFFPSGLERSSASMDFAGTGWPLPPAAQFDEFACSA
jgi:hypothetical protein